MITLNKSERLKLLGLVMVGIYYIGFVISGYVNNGIVGIFWHAFVPFFSLPTYYLRLISQGEPLVVLEIAWLACGIYFAAKEEKTYE